MGDKERVIALMREQEESMRVSVMIPWDERDRITINRLIELRNSKTQRDENVIHFDNVLKFFLSDDEFEKHVVGNVLF